MCNGMEKAVAGFFLFFSFFFVIAAVPVAFITLS